MNCQQNLLGANTAAQKKNPCCSHQVNLIKAVAIGDAIVRGGGCVLFDENSIVSGNAICHDVGTSAFFVNQVGLYEVFFKFAYSATAPGRVVFEIRNNAASRVVEQIVVSPQDGHIASSDVFLLTAGSAIELCMLPIPQSDIDAIIICNAVMIIKKL